MTVAVQNHFKPAFSLVLSVLCQILGLGAGIFVEARLGSGYAPLVTHLAVSWLTARFLRLSLPWQVFNLLLPLSLEPLASRSVPNEVFAVGSALLVLTFLPTLWTKVPYYPTSNKMYDRVLDKLPEDGNFTFIDLGSGFGWMLFYLAKHKPHGKYYGVEIGPLPYLVSKFLSAFIGNSRVKIQFKNFWHMDLSKYSVVYAFLAPDPMRALWKKVNKEMKPGSRFITNTFEVDGKAGMVDVVEDDRTYTLYTFDM